MQNRRGQHASTFSSATTARALLRLGNRAWGHLGQHQCCAVGWTMHCFPKAGSISHKLHILCQNWPAGRLPIAQLCCSVLLAKGLVGIWGQTGADLCSPDTTRAPA